MTDKAARLAKAREARKAKSEAHKKAVAEGRAKVKAEMEAEAKKTADELKRVQADLDRSAKEIEARITAAARDEDKAWDHRLAASLILADVKKTCDENKLNFKKWCEENLKEQSYETIRKLASAGAGGEKKAVKAIEDMRARNALANKKLRERKKGAKPEKAPARIDLVAAARAAVDQLTDKKQLSFLTERAKGLGFDFVPQGTAAPQDTASIGIKEMKDAFSKLNPSARLAFAKWACEEVGGQYMDEVKFSTRAAAEAANA